jgi:hypothetical protein
MAKKLNDSKKPISPESETTDSGPANEVTEYHIYKKLARFVKDPENKMVLNNIAEDD